MKTLKSLLRLMLYALVGMSLVLAGCGDDDDDDDDGGGTIQTQWQQSGHADVNAEAFNHWNEDDPPVVSESCARCHSGDGFRDFARDGVVDSAPPVGGENQIIGCSDCHTDAPATLYSDLGTYTALEPVEFPSGATVSLNGPSNMCLVCHQGREAGNSVDETIAADDDGVFNFINIHYYPAAASLFGSAVNGGYEYEGMTYRGQNTFAGHPADLTTCVGCHMGESANHTFEPQLSSCTECHSGNSFETLSGSPADNKAAIDTLVEELFAEIQFYASTVIGTDIAYSSASYPYFFIDANGDGAVSEGETSRYNVFDATLLKAAYNYQVARKEPCGYIHNGIYIRQILFDSIVDLGGTPSIVAPGREGFQPDNITEQWSASGHADLTAEAWNHWNEAEPGEIAAVPTSCGQCHSREGFLDYARDGVVDNDATAGAQAQILTCGACHTTAPDTVYDALGTYAALEPVEFPSGATATLNGPSNICMTCHQGRESGDDVNAAIANEEFGFLNIHYYAAAATVFGGDVRGGYQYAGKTYRGQNTFPAHPASLATCVGCHMPGDPADHTFEPSLTVCQGCHTSGDSFETLSGSPVLNHGNIETLSAELLAAIQDYAANTVGTAIAYSTTAYPYWFVDTNGNGLADGDEASYGNRYTGFDAELLPAAYNYQVAQKEPCGYIHNGIYIQQLLFDSIEALGGTPSVAPADRDGGGGGIPTTVVYDGGSQAPVTFNHTIHAGALACSDCHEQSPPEQIVVDGFSAHGFCVDCHETSPTAPDSTDCSTCHGN